MLHTRHSGIAVLVLAFAIPGFAQPPKQTSPQVRQKTFDAVWKAVNDKSIATQVSHIDWSAVKLRYEPQIAAVESDAQFQDVVDRMLAETKVSHLHLVDLAKLDQQLARAVVIRGLALRDLDNQVVVTRIIDGSPAAASGLRPGYVISSIDGMPLANAKSAEEKLAQDKEKHRLAVLDEANTTRHIEIVYGLPPADKIVSARIG